MSMGRVIAWAFVALMGSLPWFKLGAEGGPPKDPTMAQFLDGAMLYWGVAGVLGLILVVSARSNRVREAEEQARKQEFQRLLDQPLTEIRPAQALIKTGEKAYGAVKASLQEIRTIGYSAGTLGLSVRVAQGVTLRTGSRRGKAVKGMVSVASGELVITDKRVIFAGDQKSFAIPLEDLLGATNYTDGFGFSDRRTTYTLVTSNDRERMLFGAALNKVVRG